MNWLTKGKYYGLIALSALFLSCENDDLLSLDFDPQDETLNLSFTELTLPFQLVQRDSMVTNDVGRLLVGNYQNNVFGNVLSTGYISMGISSSAVNNADDDDELDSLLLYVAKDYFYGDVNSGLQTINIHQLAEPFNDTLTYYQDSSLPYEPNPIGSFSFTADAEEPVDTLSTHLSDVIGNDLLNKLKEDAAELDSSALFRQYFRGLALVPSSENAFVSGFERGVQMVLYYSAPDDTVSKSFSIVTSRNFNNVSVDRSSTALAEIDQPREVGSAADNRFYMQASTGIVPRINLQPLLDFVEDHPERVLLNRAVLHIGLSEPGATNPAPDNIYGYQLQDDGISRITSFNPQQGRLFYIGMYSDDDYFYDDIGQSPVPVEASQIPYDTTNISYNIRLTSFGQNLIDGYIDNPEVLIQPGDITTGMSQLTTEADSIKLRVYYTTLQ